MLAGERSDMELEGVPQEATEFVQGFFDSYWLRVRRDLWNEAHDTVVQVLVGRFQHYVTFCPDGVLVLMFRDSSDTFIWAESSQTVLELAIGSFKDSDDWRTLELDQMLPGRPTHLGFDLDIAFRLDTEEENTTGFDRLQIRFVPFAYDSKFWNAKNAKRLAVQNLGGPARWQGNA
jgi:hypothetical protein